MLTRDYRDACDQLPESSKSVILALSVLTERIESLPRADRDDLFELFQGWAGTDDPAEHESIRRAMEEILAQTPVRATPMPMPEHPVAPGARRWAEHVGGKIKEFREQAKLSQVQLADKAGLPQSHVSRLENAKHTATHLTLEKIARALGVSVGDLDPCAD